MKAEIFKVIPNTNGIYFASNVGTIKSIDHKVLHSNGVTRTQYGRILKPQICKKGYAQVLVKMNGNFINTGVHRLVALAFIGNPNNYPQVNHINCKKLDNRVENLEWCTNKQNNLHAIENNLMRPNYGEKHHLAKLKNEDVFLIIDRINKGETMSKISRDYSMSVTAISNIYHRKTYINLNL
jgi:hypothetical protein